MIHAVITVFAVCLYIAGAIWLASYMQFFKFRGWRVVPFAIVFSILWAPWLAMALVFEWAQEHTHE